MTGSLEVTDLFCGAGGSTRADVADEIERLRSELAAAVARADEAEQRAQGYGAKCLSEAHREKLERFGWDHNFAFNHALELNAKIEAAEARATQAEQRLQQIRDHFARRVRTVPEWLSEVLNG